MKTIIKDVGKNNTVVYPCLMKHVKNGGLVLFGRKSFGIVISPFWDSNMENNYPMGHSSDSWLMEYFVMSDQQVTISNS